MLKLNLPWPPSMNGYWRSVNIGQRKATLLSKRGRIYKREVKLVMLSVDRHAFTEDDRLRVYVEAHPPTRRKCDLDNYLKPLLDAIFCEDGVDVDDSQIDDLRIVRREIIPEGLMLVEISEAVGMGGVEVENTIAGFLGASEA